MIIDCHGHYTTAPKALENWRNAQIAGITLEYGTIPRKEDMMNAVRADNWLYVHGDVHSAKGRAIKAQIRAAFYQEHDDWKDMVVERGHYVMKRMLRCLGES